MAPYDSGGNHSLPAGYLAVSGQKIQPSNHNPPLEDISSSLSMVVIADGRKSMTGDLPMGNNKITGLADATNPQDAVTLSQMQDAIPDAVSGSLRYDQAQTLESGEKTQAQTNLGVSAFAQTVLDDANGAAVCTTIGAQPALGYTPVRSQVSGWSERILKGTTTITTSGVGGATISFPVAFSSTPTVIPANGSPAAAIIVNRNGVATGSFSIVARWLVDSTLVNGQTFAVDWIAVGGA